MLVFEERGKLEYLEKNLSEERREPTTNSTHIWRRRRDLNPGHIGGRQVLSPLRHPLLPWFDVSLCLQCYCVSTSAQLMWGQIHFVHLLRTWELQKRLAVNSWGDFNSIVVSYKVPINKHMKLNVSHLISTYVQIRRILRVSVTIELLAVDWQLLSLLSMDLHVDEILICSLL